MEVNIFHVQSKVAVLKFMDGVVTGLKCVFLPQQVVFDFSLEYFIYSLRTLQWARYATNGR